MKLLGCAGAAMAHRGRRMLSSHTIPRGCPLAQSKGCANLDGKEPAPHAFGNGKCHSTLLLLVLVRQKKTPPNPLTKHGYDESGGERFNSSSHVARVPWHPVGSYRQVPSFSLSPRPPASWRPAYHPWAQTKSIDWRVPSPAPVVCFFFCRAVVASFAAKGKAR